MALLSQAGLTVATLLTSGVVLWPMASPAWAQSARDALLIGDLGESLEYSADLLQYPSQAHATLTSPLGFKTEHVTILAEPSAMEAPVVDSVANAENIRSTFALLAQRTTPEAHIYVLLFGHGSYDGTQGRLNKARRDLADTDYAELVDALPSEHVIFINTASASGPFVAALSAPERIVVTATRSGTQRYRTVFPRFLVEALSSPAANLDCDGSLSMLEVYRYAALQTASHYEVSDYLATEHALIDDTGMTRARIFRSRARVLTAT